MAKDPKETPKKRGRPKGKPLSEAEIAARKANPTTHGRYAKGVLQQTGHPCKKNACPGEFPCQIRDVATEAGHGLSVCPPALLVDSRAKELIQRAIETRDPSALAELNAIPLAAMQHLGLGELAKLQQEGLVTTETTYGKDGETCHRDVANPRAAPTLRLAGMLGWEMAQQAATAKAAGEHQRDTGAAGLLERMAACRKLLEQ